jgi:hypothetical protein
MKFPGMCLVCKKKIEVNEVALWAKGLGVKHQSCAEVMQLKCMVCGNQAGCIDCEFADSCNLDKVSQICICKKCSNTRDIFSLYQSSVIKRYPMLNPK